jgi:hypothetical protein
VLLRRGGEFDDGLFQITGEFKGHLLRVVFADGSAGVLAAVESFIQREAEWQGALNAGGAGDFANWVRASPTSNLVYEAFGKLLIASRGQYHLCVTSKDGSKLYADGD